MSNKTQPALDNIALAVRGMNVAPESLKAFPFNVVDETNITAATHDYTINLRGFDSLSLMGDLTDADGTLTLKVWGTNDEDLTASGELVDITASFHDDTAAPNTSIGASVTVTNGSVAYAISRAGLNYETIIVEIVASGATNAVIVKGRRKVR